MKILSDNAYGIYLVHLLLVIALQLLVLKLNWNPNLKFIVVTVAGIGSSLLVSHLLRKIPAVKRII
jgi:glucan biosynthesis protein C